MVRREYSALPPRLSSVVVGVVSSEACVCKNHSIIVIMVSGWCLSVLLWVALIVVLLLDSSLVPDFYSLIPS